MGKIKNRSDLLHKNYNDMNRLSYIFYLVLGTVKKKFTHNRCDGCGFTKDDVYVTQYFTEAGYIECEKCYNERTKS